MNSGPSPGMQASRYYLVLTYPEGQYDGEYVEGKKVSTIRPCCIPFCHSHSELEHRAERLSL